MQKRGGMQWVSWGLQILAVVALFSAAYVGGKRCAESDDCARKVLALRGHNTLVVDFYD